jgi:hypothetical protein
MSVCGMPHERVWDIEAEGFSRFCWTGRSADYGSRQIKFRRASNRFYTRKIIYECLKSNGTAEHPFMDLTMGSRVCSTGRQTREQRTCVKRSWVQQVP